MWFIFLYKFIQTRVVDFNFFCYDYYSGLCACVYGFGAVFYVKKACICVVMCLCIYICMCIYVHMHKYYSGVEIPRAGVIVYVYV